MHGQAWPHLSSVFCEFLVWLEDSKKSPVRGPVHPLDLAIPSVGGMAFYLGTKST